MRFFVGSGAVFLESRKRIARASFESLTLVGDLKSTIEQISLSPELGCFLEISLDAGESYNQWELGDVGFARFVQSPHLKRVRSFTTGWNALSGNALDALGQTPWVSTLTKLIVMNNPLAPDAIARLAPRLANLEWLDFNNSTIDDVGAIALGSVPFHRLTWLRLGSSRIQPRGATAIANGSYRKLEMLELTGNTIGDDGATAIASAPNLGTLTELRLARAGFGLAGAQALAASTSLGSLRQLDVSSNALDAPGVDAFANGRGLRALRELDISDNVLSDEIEDWYDYDGSVIGSGRKRESHEALMARFAKKPKLKLR